MPEVMRLSDLCPEAGLVRCTLLKCNKCVNPYIVEVIAPVTYAQVPIPARLVVACPAEGCGNEWYMRDPRHIDD